MGALMAAGSTNNPAGRTAAKPIADALETQIAARHNESCSRSCAGVFVPYYRVCHLVVTTAAGVMFSEWATGTRMSDALSTWRTSMEQISAACDETAIVQRS
eukprot:SAG22_NODE_2870_length_2138_cov_1.438450_1_plen_102_part_00